MKYLIILFLLLCSIANAKFNFEDHDQIIFGTDSTNPKSITFTSTTPYSDGILGFIDGLFDFNSNITFGASAQENAKILVNRGDGEFKPYWGWNEALGKIVVSHNGSDEIEVGSGGGGGGGTGLTWVTVTDDATISTGFGYIVRPTDSATPVELTLPDDFGLGEEISIIGASEGGWELYTNSTSSASQYITYRGGSSMEAPGVKTLIARSNQYWGQVNIVSITASEELNARWNDSVDFIFGIQYFAGIEASWRMEESSGNLLDSKGSHDLSRNGTPDRVTGLIDYGQSFGAGEYFYGYYAALANTQAIASRTMSWDGYVKFAGSAATDGVIFCNTYSSGYDCDTDSFQVAYTHSTTTLICGTTSVYSSADVSAKVDGEWHHVACVIDNSSTSGSRKFIYVDGEDVGSTENTQTNFNDVNGYIIIGDGPSDSEFLGDIDEAAYWPETAMTLQQAIQRYNNSTGSRYY